MNDAVTPVAHAANSPAARDRLYAFHPMSDLARHMAEGPAAVMESGHGIYVADETGREYIESLAGLWCAPLGFSEERLVQAAARQMRRLPYYHQFRNINHDVGVELAERVVKLAPAGLSRVFFTNSGSEANDTNIKIVRYYNNALGRPLKKKIIARMNGYHGSTIAAASLSGLPYMHLHFDLPIEGILHTDSPHYYRHAQDGESEEAFATRLADSLEALILREGPDTVAAFIADPIIGSGGVIPPPRTYFDKVQPILAKYDILFIVDEVICGFGRTGRMFGGEHYGLKPDLMTVGKGLSAGYQPLSGVLVSDEVYQVIAAKSAEAGFFGHGYTHSGHPVACAVALEALKIFEERDLLGHVQTVSKPFLRGLNRFKDHPLVGDVRGIGLMGAAELVSDKASKATFTRESGVGLHLQQRAMEHGLLVRYSTGAAIFAPPLIITEEEIAEMFKRFALALDETLEFVRANDLT